MKASIITIYNKKAKKGKGGRFLHGLAMLIQVDNKRILVDSGFFGRILLKNMRILNFNPNKIDIIFLTHGHMDHTRGLIKFVEERTNKEKVQIYAHPGIKTERYARFFNKTFWNAGLPKDFHKVEKKANINYTNEKIAITDHLYSSGEFKLSGRIEEQSLSSYLYLYENGRWQIDPVLDDQVLVLKTKKGLVLVSGDCHAGLINTCKRIEQQFQEEISAVVGSIHVTHKENEQISKFIQSIKENIPKTFFYLNHTIGKKVFNQLQEKLGTDKVHYFFGGTEIIFEC